MDLKKISELRKRTGVGIDRCKRALDGAGGDIDMAISALRKEGMGFAAGKEARSSGVGLISTFEDGENFYLLEVSTETDFAARSCAFKDFVDNLGKILLVCKPDSLDEFVGCTHDGISVEEMRCSAVMACSENIKIRRIRRIKKLVSSSFGVYNHVGSAVAVVTVSGHENKDLAIDVAMHIVAQGPSYVNRKDVPDSVLEREREIAREQMKGKSAELMQRAVDGKLNGFFKNACLEDQEFVRESGMSVGKYVSTHGSGAKVEDFVLWRAGEES